MSVIPELTLDDKLEFLRAARLGVSDAALRPLAAALVQHERPRIFSFSRLQTPESERSLVFVYAGAVAWTIREGGNEWRYVLRSGDVFGLEALGKAPGARAPTVGGPGGQFAASTIDVTVTIELAPARFADVVGTEGPLWEALRTRRDAAAWLPTVVSALRATEAFSGLRPEALHHLIRRGDLVDLALGERLPASREGRCGVVLRGCLEAADPPARAMPVQIPSGKTFGIPALLAGEGVAALVAIERSLVLTFGKSAMTASMAEVPGFAPACLQAALRSGRGRPARTDNPQPVSLRLHPDAHVLLTRLARNKGKSRSMVATKMLECSTPRFLGDLPGLKGKGITTTLSLSSVALENLKRIAADNDSTLSAELTRYIFGTAESRA